MSPAACTSDQDGHCCDCRLSITSIRNDDDIKSLDERCRSAHIALDGSHLQTYIALLNEGQTPAYAAVKVRLQGMTQGPGCRCTFCAHCM